MSHKPIGKPNDTPEEAAKREGYVIVKSFKDGGVIARQGVKGYYVRKPYGEGTPPVLVALDTEGPSSIGRSEDTPAEAAGRVGYRILKRGAIGDEDVTAVDDYGMIYLIEKTGNGPFAQFLGFKDDPAMKQWME